MTSKLKTSADSSNGNSSGAATERPFNVASAADGHAVGDAVILRWLLEDFELHAAAVEARYGIEGLFAGPEFFAGGAATWNEAWEQFESEHCAWRPTVAFGPPAWREKLQAAISTVAIAPSRERVIAFGWKERFTRKLARVVLGQDNGALFATRIKLTPGQMRSICESARDRMLIIGRYEAYVEDAAKDGRTPCERAIRLRGLLPATNRRLCHLRTLTAFSALADLVPGRGRPQPPTKNVDADRGALFLGQLTDWADRQEARWSPWATPARWESVFGMTWASIKKRISAGTLIADHDSTKRWRFHLDLLPAESIAKLRPRTPK